MNKRLDEALSQIKTLSDQEQQAAAELLFEYLEAQKKGDVWLTPEQIVEIERRIENPEPFASDEEVRAVFDRLTK